MLNDAIAHPRDENNTRTRTKVPSREQTIFRNAAPGAYTSISNQLLQCEGLSADVLGFVCALLSRPPDWCFNYAWAEKQFDMGERKLLRIIRDAKAAGFMKTVRERNSAGVYTGNTVYLFTDVPNVFNADEGDDPSITAVLPATAKCQPWQNASHGKMQVHTKETQNLEKKDCLAHPADGATYSALNIGAGGGAKSAYSDSFQAFWETYPKKRGKAKAAERWGKMSDAERQEARDGIKLYMQDKKARDGFVQQADTYLVKRTWEDYPPSECAGDPEASIWTGRLKRYAENRSWPIRGQWGPPPGAPGCTVPKPIIDRYFTTNAAGELTWKSVR